MESESKDVRNYTKYASLYWGVHICLSVFCVMSVSAQLWLKILSKRRSWEMIWGITSWAHVRNTRPADTYPGNWGCRSWKSSCSPHKYVLMRGINVKCFKLHLGVLSTWSHKLSQDLQQSAVNEINLCWYLCGHFFKVHTETWGPPT